MARLVEGAQLFATFRERAESGNIAAAKSILTELKILMTEFESLPPMGLEGPNAARERTLARDTMEVAVFLSAREGDNEAFQRHMAQLKPYYMDFGSQLPASPNQSPVRGLNLLFLLVENRLAEFHSELELMDDAERAEECVVFPVQLEQYLMVGSYDQVLAARDKVPHAYYKYFLDSLLDTVREGIAECSEAAYSELSVSEAQKMLRMSTRSELEAFVANKHPEWEITPTDKIIFRAPETTKKSAEIPSMRLIAECLSYATELERIV